MTTTADQVAPRVPDEGPLYPCRSLIDLARAIADHGDPNALAELLEHRPVFRLDGRRLLLSEFIMALLDAALGRGTGRTAPDLVLEAAADLTLDKFSRLPGDQRVEREMDGEVKQPAPDCRMYYKAFLDGRNRAQKGRVSRIEEEVEAARALQGLVARHFRFSRLECERRENPLISRYAWHLPGGTLRLWMPVNLGGRARRAWLEANVPDVDPLRPEEQRRVQDLIDRRFQMARTVPLRQHLIDELVGPDEAPTDSDASRREMVATNLARSVAREKANHIRDQRCAIQALGAAQLEAMVLRIFDDLDEDRLNLDAIARRFGVSKATLSRFAGSRWSAAEKAEGSPVPDLWANTAHVLADQPEFVEAAQRAGVWEQVKTTLAHAQFGGQEKA